MSPFLITLGIFGLAVVGMAVGAILVRKPLKGTCGGLNTLRPSLGGDSVCEICGKDPSKEETDCQEEDTRDAQPEAAVAAAEASAAPGGERSGGRPTDPLYG